MLRVKTCLKCDLPKEDDEFGRMAANKDGLHRWCRPCKRLYENSRAPSTTDEPPLAKVCSACGEEKILDEFNLHRRRRDGRHPQCKACMSLYQRGQRLLNSKGRLPKTPAHLKKQRAVRSKRFRSRHPERARDYRRKRYDSDLSFKLSVLLRSRIAHAVEATPGLKGGSAVKDLGCTVGELRMWLEAQFYPHPETGEQMTWGNHSKDGWHIDHKRPLKEFDLTDCEQFLQACHYTNLQPLWAEQNLAKGAKEEWERAA